MEVVFDSAKDAINIRKHGISLRRGKDFDFDSALFEVDDREEYGETRIMGIGFLDARLYSLTFVVLSETVIRAISLRTATTQERKNYADS